jgi:hypothetical protein
MEGRGLRWRFPQPGEAAAREEVLARIDRWWRAFTETAPRVDDYFHGRERWDLGEWMHEHLGAVDERLMWEFGPGTRGGHGHRLVVTPESERQLRPLVEVVLSRAPELPGWEFFPHRLAEPLEAARETVKGRTGIDIAGWTAAAAAGEHGLVDIVVCPGRSLFRSTAKDQEAAFVALESLLGEEVLETFVGAIDVEQRKGTAPLSELPARVSALIAEAQARLPSEPYLRRAADAEWTLLELKPEPADDYPEQLDLLVAKTADIELWKAQHSGLLFEARRHSRVGETFAYLKIDGAGGLPEGGFADKGEIEDAVTAALEPDGLGAHVGGGTGLRYSYVDLALTDVNAAIEALRPVLRRGKLPLRSWLLFFEAPLASEWIPIWDEAPPPP